MASKRFNPEAKLTAVAAPWAVWRLGRDQQYFVNQTARS